MNNLTLHKESFPSLAMSEDELMNVLRNSLYPGAKDESIKLVVGYCKASGLDVMQKPVHIVPMWDSKANAMRDVIMPGVGSYRTQAARSGEYAGVSDPEFGPDVTETIGGQKITFPSWCKVTVKRRISGEFVAEFSATERWIENYAVKGGKEKSIAPNAMWTRRPYGQLAKCAEAQALRKAFPECGAQPTADEMEGNSFYDGGTTIDGGTGEILNGKEKPKELPEYTDEQLKNNIPAWRDAINAGRITTEKIITKISSGYRITAEQLEKIRSLKKQEPVDPFVADMEAEERGENQ
jgi:phage recombination protein Bet